MTRIAQHLALLSGLFSFGWCYSQEFNGEAFIQADLHFVSQRGGGPIWVYHWVGDEESGKFEWVEVPQRTSGLGPAFDYYGPENLSLIFRQGATFGEAVPVFLTREVQRFLVVLVSDQRRSGLGARHSGPGVWTGYGIPLPDRDPNSSGKLKVFNATQAVLSGSLREGDGGAIQPLVVEPGLNQFILQSQRGRVGFQYDYGSRGRHWVYAGDFARSANRNILLILAPPRIEGGRDLVGRWIELP